VQGRVLVLAHTDELIGQARDKMRRANGLESELEKAGDRASLNAPLVVSSVQTLARPARLERFPKDHFWTLIIDEAHRALAPSYRRILDHFGDAKTLGTTATADRSDKRSLAAVFQDVAHEVFLVQLIRQGYLCPITVQTVPVKIDLSGVAVRAGDFSEEDLGEALDPVLEPVAEGILEYARERRTLVCADFVRGWIQGGVREWEVRGSRGETRAV
jgi:superfamily II DNA or RNA helicase